MSARTLLTVSVLLLGPAPLLAQSSPGRSGSKVKVACERGKPDAEGKQTITINLDVAEGWHIYANPVGSQDLQGGETIVRVYTGTKVVEAKVDYPAGKAVKLFDLDPFYIWEGKVSIKARVEADDGPLEIRISMRVVSDSKGLPPETLKVKVP